MLPSVTYPTNYPYNASTNLPSKGKEWYSHPAKSCPLFCPGFPIRWIHCVQGKAQARFSGQFAYWNWDLNSESQTYFIIYWLQTHYLAQVAFKLLTNFHLPSFSRISMVMNFRNIPPLLIKTNCLILSIIDDFKKNYFQTKCNNADANSAFNKHFPNIIRHSLIL